jgi:serine/threonine-protein kinase
VAEYAPLHGSSWPVKVGDVVDKYRVERVVGIGAMGVVVAARHTTLDQVVAIKFLVEHVFGSKEESVARFLNEARAAARIDSDYVCRVSDVGALPSGVPYMVMEHLDGNDLEEELEARGRLDIVEAVDYVLQTLDAIAAAHQLGIVHRDLKPANLFLARRPDGSRRVKVLDFGISKVTTTVASTMTTKDQRRYTKATRSLGTPAYMPPEQITDPTSVDHRADIWALGAILYELVTGQMAFAGDTVKEVLDRVLTEEPCPVEALRPEVPRALAAVVSRALSRDRNERWQSAAMFARALAPFGSMSVLGGLTNVTREVGSLSSIPAISSLGLPTPVSSVAPIVASLTHEMPTQTEITETSRRYLAAQDWAALQKRKRRASTALLVLGAAFFLTSTAALLAYRVGHDEPLASQDAPPAAAAASGSAAARSLPPPPALSTLPPSAPSSARRATPAETPSAKPSSAPEPVPPPTGSPSAKHVQHATKYVHVAPKRSSRPPASASR